MLVLSRKIGESIVINGNITVTICEIRDCGHKVRVGIEAPREVTVHREEIQRRIDAQAAEPMSDDPATGD